MPPNDRGSHKELILCLDDDVDGLAARKAVLALAGFEVISTPDPAEAVRIVASQRVDLVIFDQFLKGVLGTELAKTMKAMRPTVPILILSGSIDKPDDLGGADDFMCKTDGPEALIEIGHRLVARGGRGQSNGPF
jgi:DNA-binding response OmpR family regulator